MRVSSVQHPIDIPYPWIAFWDNASQAYFYVNEETNERVWSLPESQPDLNSSETKFREKGMISRSASLKSKSTNDNYPAVERRRNSFNKSVEYDVHRNSYYSTNVHQNLFSSWHNTTTPVRNKFHKQDHEVTSSPNSSKSSAFGNIFHHQTDNERKLGYEHHSSAIGGKIAKRLFSKILHGKSKREPTAADFKIY